jgi:hypothetical protein
VDPIQAAYFYQRNARDYLCLLDESESGEKVQDPFFVYGALLIPLLQARPLHDRIVRIREVAGIPPEVPLKWNMDAVPGVSPAALALAKSAVVEASRVVGARLFVSIVHRRIASGQKRGGRAHEFGAKTVLQSVGKHLDEKGGTALFLFDRFPGMGADAAHDFLADRMAKGFGHEDSPASTPPALGLGFINSGSSRLASALDVTIGAFVRCLAQTDRGPLEETGSLVVGLLAQRADGRVWERGLIVRPMKRILTAFVPAYERVLTRLRGLGLPELAKLRIETDSRDGFSVIRV